MAERSVLSSSLIDTLLTQIAAGTPVSSMALRELAESPDLLALGMLSDGWRRQLHSQCTTYLRVFCVEAQTPIPKLVVPVGAREVRIVGEAPAAFALAVSRVVAVKALAGRCTLTAFSWLDVDRWAGEIGGHRAVLTALRGAGLDGLATASLDSLNDPVVMLKALTDAGFVNLRLTVDRPAPMAERLEQWLRLAGTIARVPVVALAPLPLSQQALRPTTGYDDVKAVALARLALPQVPHIQVDWLRYGPKLAQVALTFGADDIDNVSPTDESPDGRRRAPLEELRRNVEAAGMTAVERSGLYAAVD